MDLPEINKQPLLHVDATPDDNYVLRILQAYRANCDCVWVSEPENLLVQEMNRLQKLRAEKLDLAIAKLTTPTRLP